PDKGPVWAGTGSFFIGIGMGMTTTVFIVSIQSAVNWEVRGIATASNMFMRTLGSALGAALLGGLLNSRIKAFLIHEGLAGEANVDTVNKLLDPNQLVSLPKEIMVILQNALTNGLHTVYGGLLVLSIISFIVITLIPKKES